MGGAKELQEKALVEITQWLGRVLQYSAAHPVAQALGAHAHESLVAALQQGGPLEVGVLKDNLLFGDVPATHPVLRIRTAPYLHERGVLLLRFAVAVRLEELSSLVELLALPVPDLF